MSLDFYLYEPRAVEERISKCDHCGHATVVPAGVVQNDVFWQNITHNLGAMAAAAGIYEALWRPQLVTNDPAWKSVAETYRELCDAKRHHEAEKIIEVMPDPTAASLAPMLRAGLSWLLSNEAEARKHDAPNGWGLYQHFVPFVEEVLRACEEHPDAFVKVSR